MDVDGTCRGRIAAGLAVLAGLFQGDTEADLAWSADKIAGLRIFPDEQGKMNRSVKDIGGGVLLIPNFTLAGDARKGRRPGFDRAMRPETASPMFDRLCELVAAHGPTVQRGVFRAHMVVTLSNDGPVTLVLDSREHPDPS